MSEQVRENDAVIILGKLSSSQSAEVMDGQGLCKALMAGGHGYADSYVLVEVRDVRTDRQHLCGEI